MIRVNSLEESVCFGYICCIVRGVPQNTTVRGFKMNNDTATPETRVTLNVQQLESIKEIFKLDKESPIYEDIQDILERKKSGQLKFHTHEKMRNY